MFKLHSMVLALGAAVLIAAAAPAVAQQDSVQFFQNVEVTPANPVHDAICFFCNVNVQGKVTGDIVVFFGNLNLKGDAQHDVVSFFGNIRAADNSSIDDDLLSVLGNVYLGQNVSIGRDITTAFSAVEQAPTVTVGGTRTSMPLWIIAAPLGILLLIILVIVREMRAYRRRLIARGYKFPPRA